MNWRQRLISQRPEAKAYAQSITALPESIVGMKGKIATVNIAPIKSASMLRLPDGARVGKFGLTTPDALVTDRWIALATKESGIAAQGRYEFVRLSQREQGALAQIVPRYEEGCLRCMVPGMGSFAVPEFRERSRLAEPMLMSEQTGEVSAVWVDDGELSLILRDALDCIGVPWQNVFVVQQHPDCPRRAHEKHQCNTDSLIMSSDGGAVTVDSLGTVLWMNDLRFRAALNADAIWPYVIDERQFRMNITLDGILPNVEDLIDEIVIGPERVPLRFGGMCVRCSMTCLNPDTGESEGKDPLRFLAKERPNRPGDPNTTTFGINCAFPPETLGEMIEPDMEFEIVKEK